MNNNDNSTKRKVIILHLYYDDNDRPNHGIRKNNYNRMKIIMMINIITIKIIIMGESNDL